MKFIYKISLLFLFFPLLLFAKSNGKKQEKSKTINKVFSVSRDAKLAINNRYGNLNITTWSKNSIEIQVTITVKGSDKDQIIDRLENIDVIFESSANFVSAKTTFEKERKSWSFWKNNKGISYQINYKVKMPKSNSVDLDNDYGSIFLGDLDGNANINCDYGKISAGKLTAENNSINLDYCSLSSIAYLKSGAINIDYSKLTIDETEQVKVNSDYSTFKAIKAGSVIFNADYGAIRIDEANEINGNSDYTDMRFGTVYKNLTIDTDYGAVSVKRLVKDFENVVINGEYAGIRIEVDANAVFDFEMSLQYASFSYDRNDIEFYTKESKSNKKYYEGKFGVGSSNSRIKIKSQYGGVSIRKK